MNRFLDKTILVGLFLLICIIWFVYDASDYSVPAYVSHLETTKKKIYERYKDDRVRLQLVRFAEGLDEVLANPALTDEQFELDRQGKTKKSKAIACIVLISDTQEILESIEVVQEWMIPDRSTLKRYRAYDKQFYGKMLEINSGVSRYEEDCL